MASSGVQLPVQPERHRNRGIRYKDAVLAHGCSLLVKGGHAEGETVIDRLLETGEGEVARWEAPRIDTPHSHGTGCTLASAIATGLAQGMPLEPAIARARDFVRLSLLDAPGLGQGHRPMGQQFVRNDGLFTGPALNQIPSRQMIRGVVASTSSGGQSTSIARTRLARFEREWRTMSSRRRRRGGGATAYLRAARWMRGSYLRGAGCGRTDARIRNGAARGAAD